MIYIIINICISIFFKASVPIPVRDYQSINLEAPTDPLDAPTDPLEAPIVSIEGSTDPIEGLLIHQRPLPTH